MSITSKELAQLCGVSRATVDRVVNKRGKVKPETEEKILNLAAQHGYRPNRLASSLSTGTTHSIGVVVPNLRNAFFANLLDEITVQAHKLNYITLVQIYQDLPENETECIYNLFDRNVDGIILFSMQKEYQTAQLIQSLKIPVVALCNKIEGVVCVKPDYNLAMFDAANYMISCGYSKIIYVSPPLQYREHQNMNSMEERYEGFLKAVVDKVDYDCLLDDTYLTQLANMSDESFENVAVLCSNDMYALKILNVFLNRGLKIPKNVGLMGFDNLDILQYVRPIITTTGLDIEELGKSSVDEILTIINGSVATDDLILAHKINLGQTIIQR